MIIAVRVITITALFLALNLLTLGSQQDSLRELIRTTQDEDEQAMLYLELSKTSNADQLKALKEAEKIFKSNSNNSVGIETYLQYGSYYLENGQSDSAIFYIERALNLSDLLNDRFYTARSNQELGNYYFKKGEFGEARKFLISARNMFAAMKDTFWLLQQMNMIARLEIAEGDIGSGERIFNEVLRKGIKTRDKVALAEANYSLGNIAFLKGRKKEAFEKFKSSLDLTDESENPYMVAKIHTKLSKIYLDIGLDSIAYKNLLRARELNAGKNRDILAESNLYLADFYVKSSDVELALISVDEAIENAGLIGDNNILLEGIIKKARIFKQENKLNESRLLIEENLDNIKDHNNPELRAKGYEIYSSILFKQGDINGAANAGAIAYEDARSAGNLELMQKSAFTLGQVMNERGQYISASRFLLLSNEYKDSLVYNRNNENFKSEVYQFENGKLNAGENNDFVDKNDSILKRDEANSRIQNLLLVSIALLVILISFFSVFVFKGFKSNRKLYNDLKPTKSGSGKNDELEKLAVLNNKIFSVISHDLRSPIISIKDSIDFLRQEELDEETKQEALILSEELAEATLNLLDNLLGWAKNQKKKVDPKKVQVNVLDEIKQIEYLYKASMLKKEINFTIDCTKDIVALADTELINLALRNLVSNAVKFTPRGGNIHVASSVFDNKVLISVKDTGIGISKEDQSKILTPDTFFTKNGTENESGSGIGLKLVNEFVKIMDGELKIESSPGQGSKFLFTLPAANLKKNPKPSGHVFKHTIN